MSRYIGIVLVILFSYSLSAAKEKSVESIDIKADKAYLRWKATAPGSPLSQPLKELLNSEKALTFLSAAAVGPSHALLSLNETREALSTIVTQFFKQFDPKHKSQQNSAELYELIEEIVVPYSVFQVRTRSADPLEISYATLMDTLRDEKTRVGTDLEAWAMRFLTAESLIIALQLIEKFNVQGKSFFELSGKKKKIVLQAAADLILNRFSANLRAVQEKFRFSLPTRIDEALREKVLEFLQETFIR